MIVFALVGAVLVVLSRAATPSIGPVSNSVIYDGAGYHTGFPAMERLKNGDLLIVFRHGSAHASGDGKLMLGRSVDNGYNWSFSTLYDDTGRDDRVNTGLKQLSDGTILLPFVKAGGPKKNETFVMKSTDNGYNWSAPTVVPNPNPNKWLFSYGKIVELPSKIIMPAYQRMIDDSLPQEAVLMSSTNKGQSWSLYSTVAYHGSIWWNETSLVPTSDTNWIAFIRRDGADPNQKIFQYKTSNSGQNWTSTEITRQISPDGIVLSNGVLLLCTGGQRGTGLATTIRCQMTTDSGSSWFGAKDIYSNPAGGDGGYPSTVQLSDGTVLTAYYLPNTTGTKIGLARYRTDGSAPPPPPAPAVTLSASSSSVTTNSPLSLSWSATNNPSCNASGTWSGSKPASGSENRSSDTASAGTKNYTLTCSNAGGSNSKTVSVNVTNPPPPPPQPLPGTPQNLRITASTSNSISLAWNAPSGTVDYYKVLWGSKIAFASTTSFKVTGLTACNSYTFTVAAHNSSGDSNASNPVSGSTTGCSTGGGGPTSPPPPPPPPQCNTCGRPAPPRPVNANGQEVTEPEIVPSSGGSGYEASEFDISPEEITRTGGGGGAALKILLFLPILGAGLFFLYRRRQTAGTSGYSSYLNSDLNIDLVGMPKSEHKHHGKHDK